MQRKYSASRCIKSRFTSISATAGDGRLAGETSVRLKKTQLTKKLQKEICQLTTRYGRKNWA